MPALLLGGSGRGYGRCVPMHHPLTKAFWAWKGFGKALSRLLEELEKKGFRRGFILSNFVFLFRSLLILSILSYECKCRTGCLIQFGSKAHAYIHSSESETIYLVNVKHDAEWMHSSLHWFQYRCRFTRRKDIQSWYRNLSLECWVQSSGRRARSSHLSRIRRIKKILSFVNIRKIRQNGIVFWRFEQNCGRNTKRFSLSNMWWFRKTWKKAMVSLFQYAPNMSKLQSDLQRKWKVFLRTTNFKWILQDDWKVAECERPKVQLHQYETWM